ASEPRLTTRPPPRATMSRTTRWHVVIGPRRLTSMMRPHVAGSLSRNGPITSMPALLTRMSIGPSSASVRCTAAWTLGASVTSTRMPAAEGACLPATATARSSSRSHTATAAPAAASAPTIASPIPRPPPVTTATRPCSAICPPLLARRPAEVRRPLLTVRRQALCGVRTSEPEELIGERRVERRRHDAVPVVERVLGPPQRALCAGGERHRHLERLGPHLVVLDAQRHQPDALGLLAAERLARQEVVLRLGHPAQQRPTDRGMVAGGDPEAGMAIDDARRPPAHRHIGEQGGDEAGPNGRAVDGRDDRLRAVDDVEHDVARFT